MISKDILTEDQLRPLADCWTRAGLNACLLGHTTERMTAHYTTVRRGFVSKSATLKPDTKEKE